MTNNMPPTIGTIYDLSISEFTRTVLSQNGFYNIPDILPMRKNDLVRIIGKECYNELFPALQKQYQNLVLWRVQ